MYIYIDKKIWYDQICVHILQLMIKRFPNYTDLAAMVLEA